MLTANVEISAIRLRDRGACVSNWLRTRRYNNGKSLNHQVKKRLRSLKRVSR